MAQVAWLYKPIKNLLIAEADSKIPFETGGILMGYVAPSQNAVVISHASCAGPNARHDSFHYSPDYDFDDKQVSDMYTQSKGKITYLGDWHTHLGPVTDLSTHDLKTLRTIARAKSARISTPIMLILSLSDNWTVTVWQGAMYRRSCFRNLFKTHKLEVELFSYLPSA